MKQFAPSQLNDMFRLVLIAKRCGPHVFDNAESFDGVVGRGRFSDLDSSVLSVACRIVESFADRGGDTNVHLSDFGQNVRENALKRQGLGGQHFNFGFVTSKGFLNVSHLSHPDARRRTIAKGRCFHR
jgi:hypothetical protein